MVREIHAVSKGALLGQEKTVCVRPMVVVIEMYAVSMGALLGQEKTVCVGNIAQ